MDKYKPFTLQGSLYLAVFFSVFLCGAEPTTAAPAKPALKVRTPIEQAEMLVKEDKAELAMGVLNKIVKKEPRNARAWYLLGVAHEDMTIMEGSSKLARECFSKALAIDSQNSDALLKMGELAGIDGDWKTQIDYCNRALDTPSPTTRAYRTRAIARGNLHQDKEALADYEKFLAISPNRLQHPLVLDEYATFLENAHQYDKAITTLTSLQQVNHKPSVKVRRAKCYLKAGKPAECLAIMNMLIAKEPEDETLYSDRARMFITMGKLKDAMKDWDKVIALEPNSKYFEARADLWDKMGDHIKAKADRQKALTQN